MKLRGAYSILLFFLVFNVTTAQKGPGGVGDTNGITSLTLWLNANTIGQANGSNVTAWSDQSGYTNNASTPVGREPTFQTNVLNGIYPVVRFTAANNDYLTVADNATLKPNTISIFLAGKYNSASSNNYAPFIIKTTTDSWNDGYGIARNNNLASQISFVTSSAANFVTTALATGTNTLITSVYDKTNIELFYNEASQGTDNFAANITNSNSVVYLGMGPNAAGTGPFLNTRALDGDIAEAIVINRNVNSAERIVINNYLSAKYNIALTANDKYTMDNAGNGNFDHDVAGIARVNATNIQNDSQGTGFVRINNPTDLADGEYFFWGHDNGTAQSAAVDVPAGLTGRFTRIWRVSEVGGNGDVGNIDISFDVTGLPDFTGLQPCDAAGSIYLLVDTNNDGLFADQTPISGATNIGGNVYRFANVSAISDGMRFTIGTKSPSVNGPGGVGGTNGATGLVLWLNANSLNLVNGSNVSAWSDLSGYGNNASTVAGREPTFQTNQMNGFPVIRFTSANNDYLTVADAASLKPNTISIFLATKYNSAASDPYAPIVIKTTSDSWTDGYGVTRENNIASLRAFVTHWSNNAVVSALATGTNSLVTSIYDKTNIQLFYNETSQGTDNFAANITNSNSVMYLGMGPNGAGTGPNLNVRALDGDIAEAIIINRNVNSTERILINNYLSAKYNIAIAAGSDKYTRDNAGNGNFDYDVAGIGQVGVGNNVTDARGSGMVRVSNPSGLANGEFFMWGHDNAALNVNSLVGIPAFVQARMNRVWAVSEAFGDVGNVDIQFDLTGLGAVNSTDLRLLVDLNGDGSFADSPNISGAFAQSCNIYQFSAVSAINDGMRFTLGTVNKASTSLPIELVSFEGYARNNGVELKWTTETEINNDYFSIERSANGENFESIAKVKGAGTSITEKKYTITDPTPFMGSNYYRLKQFNFDGDFSYSKIISVTPNFLETSIAVSPNPIKIGQDLNVRILGSENIDTNNIGFVLYDMLGRAVQIPYETAGINNFNLKTGAAKIGGLYILNVRTAKLNLHQRVYLTE